MAFAACGDRNDSTISIADVADAIGAFTAAYANGDVEAVESYWSASCTSEEREMSRTASGLLADLLPGHYEVQVDSSLLAVDSANSDSAVIPLEQPPGAITATTDNVPYPEGLPFELPLSLVREDDEWKVASCVLFTNDGDGADDTPQP